jgi:hypothetical protein
MIEPQIAICLMAMLLLPRTLNRPSAPRDCLDERSCTISETDKSATN